MYIKRNNNNNNNNENENENENDNDNDSENDLPNIFNLHWLYHLVLLISF